MSTFIIIGYLFGISIMVLAIGLFIYYLFDAARKNKKRSNMATPDKFFMHPKMRVRNKFPYKNVEDLENDYITNDSLYEYTVDSPTFREFYHSIHDDDDDDPPPETENPKPLKRRIDI